MFWLLVLTRAPRTAPAVRWGVSAGLVALLLHGTVDGNLTYVTGNAFLAFALAGAWHAPVDR